jgi:hypothetical protein
LIELSRDALQELVQDGEFMLSRGLREGDQAPLLVVTPVLEHPAPARGSKLKPHIFPNRIVFNRIGATC